MASGGLYSRTIAVDDISIRADGEGRTVSAYAAIWGVLTEIKDQDGHYMERLDRSSMSRTIRDRVDKIGYFFNHSRNMYGGPSDLFSIPIGKLIDLRVDTRGLLSVARFNRTDTADQVLESIKNGDAMGMSFSGKFLRSQRDRGLGGELDTVVRQEVALREVGPTPSPAYAGAVIVGVRAAGDDDTDDEDDAALHSASVRRARLTAARIR